MIDNSVTWRFLLQLMCIKKSVGYFMPGFYILDLSKRKYIHVFTCKFCQDWKGGMYTYS